MAEVVVATLNVSFDGDDDSDGGAELKLEIDDREDGANGGETSFSPGDDVYFFLFKGLLVEIIPIDGKQVASTAGAATLDTPLVEIEKEENISFSNSDTASLGYPITSVVGTPEWLGKSFAIKGTTVSSNTAKPEYEIGSTELKMAGKKQVSGVYHIKYKTKGDLYKLSGVPKDFLEAMLICVGKY